MVWLKHLPDGFGPTPSVPNPRSCSQDGHMAAATPAVRICVLNYHLCSTLRDFELNKPQGSAGGIEPSLLCPDPCELAPRGRCRTLQHPLPPLPLAQAGSGHWHWFHSVISAAKQLSNSCDGCPDTESPPGNPSHRPLLQVSDPAFLFSSTHNASAGLGLLSDSFPLPVCSSS